MAKLCLVFSQRLTLLPLLLALACGASATPAESPDPASAEKPAQDQPKPDIKAMFAREAGELTSQPITARDKRWTASVDAKSSPTIENADPNIVIVKIPIGSDSAVHCQVHYETIDAGGAIYQLLSAIAQKAEFQNIAPWAVTIDNADPAAWVEAIYLVDQAEGKAAGHLKLAIGTHGDYPLFCLHDEIGYKESFRRVVQGFFQTFRPSQKSAEPMYQEVASQHIGKIPVGFSKSALTKESEGRQRWTTTSMMMLPVAQANLRLEDEVHIQIIDAKKELVSGRWVEAAEGKLSLNIQLERVKGNLYRYEGQAQGKPIKGELRTKSAQGLPNEFSRAATLKKRLAQSKPFSFVQEEYAPSLDPTKLQAVTYHREAADPPRAVRVKIGDIDTLATVDEHGMLSEARVRLGKVELDIRRELQQGKF